MENAASQIVRFGRHCGKTYEWVVSNDEPYFVWCMSQESPSGPMKAMIAFYKTYLQSKEIKQQMIKQMKHKKLVGVVTSKDAFVHHKLAFEALGLLDYEFVKVPAESDLKEFSALVVAEGDKTRMENLLDPLKDYVKSKKPVWGISEGCILLSNRVSNGYGKYALLSEDGTGGAADVITCGYFFRYEKKDPIETELKPKGELADFIARDSSLHKQIRAVCLKAPAIVYVSREVEVLGCIQEPGWVETFAAVRQDNILLTTFHPEWTDNKVFHRFFLERMVENRAPIRPMRETRAN